MTAYSNISSLKFDEATVSLGDELRAARAALGRSVHDVEADLRIKSKYIEAIEAADLSALPDKVYADGFVRSYAKYLGLDSADVMRRFNEESGFVAKIKTGSGKSATPRSHAEDSLARLDRRTRQSASSSGVLRSLLALWPLVLLAAFVAAIWYGIQAARDAGMLPEEFGVFGEVTSEDTVVEANLSDSALNGQSDGLAAERPENLSYAEPGAQPFWETVEENEPPLDGPIADVDTDLVGVFAEPQLPVAGPPSLQDGVEVASIAPDTANGDLDIAGVDAQSIAAAARAALTGGEVLEDATEAVVEPDPALQGFALVARAETWVEVRSPSGSVAFSGILNDGERFDIPDSGTHTVKIGNAGGLFAVFDGREVGPFGGSGAVMRGVSLAPDALRARFATQSAENTAIQ